MTGVGSECRYSMNPYHECNEYCIKNIYRNINVSIMMRFGSDDKIIDEVKKSASKNEGLHPECRYLSNPYHLCNEYCFKIITGAKKPASKNEERHPDCRYLSNPYHECNEYCFKIIADDKKPPSTNEGLHPDCKYLSNPYHECNEYCFKIIADDKKPPSTNEGLHPDCKKLSNPYHVCDEYCFKIIADDKKPPSTNEGLHPDCKNLSNPYHVCDEFCFKMIADAKRPATKNEPDGSKVDSRRSFQPTLVATELPKNDDDEKSDEWKRFFGEISKLNLRVDQLEIHQNENRIEAERRHREILQRLDLLQQQPLMQH